MLVGELAQQLAAAGARATLALSPPLHVLLAMAGTFALARRLGISPAGGAFAGACFGRRYLLLALKEEYRAEPLRLVLRGVEICGIGLEHSAHDP